METSEQARFDRLYKEHPRALHLQGMSDKAIDVYARAVRRVAERFDCHPSRLTREQLACHFEQLVDSHSWSTVKVDRNGIQFFWKHDLKRDWQWVEIIKASKVKTLPDILTVSEVEQLIGAARKLGVCLDHLFHGAASRRDPGATGRRYRCRAPARARSPRQRSQGPLRAPAGALTDRLACPVVQAPSSHLAE